jgi:aspartate-semialdehyde dehydrogenase
MNRKRSIGLIAVVLLLAGCAARPVHPGAANSFDSNSYDAVLVAHSVIETTKTDLTNNAFPASIAGQVKTALNDLIKAYDIADTAYTTYHAAAVAGKATMVQSTAVSSALTDLQTKSAALTAAKKVQ